jgi:hypothetical protein
MGTAFGSLLGNDREAVHEAPSHSTYGSVLSDPLVWVRGSA